jgi:hypothetical protein
VKKFLLFREPAGSFPKVYESLSLDPFLSQVNPAYILIFYFPEIHFSAVLSFYQ